MHPSPPHHSSGCTLVLSLVGCYSVGNLSVGSIFGIYAIKDVSNPNLEDVLQPGSTFIAAGYVRNVDDAYQLHYYDYYYIYIYSCSRTLLTGWS